jgi:hypothetical protein
MEPGIGGRGSGLLLHCGIDFDQLLVVVVQVYLPLGGIQRFNKQQFAF